MFSTMLLLLLCFISYRETSTRCVTGKIGSNVTLSCEFEARDIFHIDLSRLSKRILVCQNEECESENDRLFKKGSCDIIIKDLIFSDAGKYILRVHYTNDQGEVEREYHLHIHDEISVKTGEQLKMDVLLINADKVEKNSSGEWTEVWTRGHGVSSDRLTDRDGNLTISNFTVSDTGTYRVLDSEGEILIMVTVTDSSTGTVSKRKKDKPIDTEQHTAVFWILSVGLPVFGVLLALPLIILAGIKMHKKKKQNRKAEQDSPQVFPMEELSSDD